MSRHFHDRLRSSFCRFLNYLCICTVPYLCVILIFRFPVFDTHFICSNFYTLSCAAFICHILQNINCLIFKRLSVPFACLHYGSLWNFDCVVTPRRFVHKQCTDFYLASTDLLWLIHLGSFAIKVLGASLPVWLLSNLISVGFGSDALWGCHFIHRRHPISICIAYSSSALKRMRSFISGFSHLNHDLSQLTFFSLIFSINILIYANSFT